MFEKEAEEKGVEYANKQQKTTSIHEDTGYSWGQVEEGYENGFKAGAEFGYNKGKEEVEQWHILAENPKDVPAENSVVKVLTEDNIIQESTYFYDDYFEEMAFSNVGLVKVLAWKEIVLPELK